MATTTPTAPRPVVTQDATPSASINRDPIAVFRFERVSAAVFADNVKTPGGMKTFLNVSVRRSYKDADDAWQFTHRLSVPDLLPAALALMKCYDFAEDALKKDEKKF